MAIDWVGFAYAAAIALGGYVGYKRKGSVMSLIAGLVFGGFSAYGAYRVSSDPNDVKVALLTSGTLTAVMGNEIQEVWKIDACWHYGRTKFADGVTTAPLHDCVTREMKRGRPKQRSDATRTRVLQAQFVRLRQGKEPRPKRLSLHTTSIVDF